MKKIYKYICSILFAVALALSGCAEYEEVVEAPFVLPFDTIVASGNEHTSKELNFSSHTDYYDYSVKSDAEWVKIVKQGTVAWKIEISKNETISPRTTSIIVSVKDTHFGGAEYAKTISVSQSEGEATADIDEAIEFTADAGYRTYEIETNLPQYTVSCDASWVTVTKSESGKHLYISVKVNPENYSRYASLVVKGSGYTKTVATIHQKGMPFVWEVPNGDGYTVENDNEINLNVSGYAADYDIKIHTNLSWEYMAYEYTGGRDWVTVNTPSCSVETKTDATITSFKFSVAENRWANRQLMLKVYAKKDQNRCTYITINQPNIPNISFLQEQMTIDPTAKEYSVGISAEGNWYATCDADWLTLTRDSGGGNDSVITFAVTENTTEPMRTATIKLGLAGWEKEVAEMTVTQTCEGALYYTQKEGTTSPIALQGSNPFDVPIAEHYYDPTTCEGGITFLGTPTKIGESAFANSQLASIILPNTIKEIGYAAFENSQLKEITLHDGLEVIDGLAFSGCKISSINIPTTVRAIGSAAFATFNLKGVYMTDLSAWCQIEYGNNYAANPLYGGGKLYLNGEPITELTIPSEVTRIKKGAFQYFTDLETLIIPDCVTVIEDYAFDDCTNLKSVSLGNGVEKIGWVAFGNCESLSSITIPNSVNEIEDGAFHDCKSMQAFYGKFASSDNRSLVVNGVLNAFASVGVTDYIIPNGVVTIGQYVFMNCKNLTSVVIPEGVKVIGEHAFAYCERLSGLNLPESLTGIDRGAFTGCHGVTNVTIPNGVEYISAWAFDYCEKLATVTIGSGIKEIGCAAFSRCNNLVEINCKAVVPPTLYDTELDTFVSTSANLTIYVPTASVEAYKVAEYWSNYASQIAGKDF